MPQFILAIIIIYWVILAVIWVVNWAVKWIAVGAIFVWQVFLMPFFVYFAPAIITLVIIAAIFLGSWIAVKNYFASLKTHINPMGSLKRRTKYYIISMLILFLATIYLSLIVSSLVLIYRPVQLFVVHVIEYYESIFPHQEVIYQENDTFHIGDEENLTSSGWKFLPNCFTATFYVDIPIQTLTLKLEIRNSGSRSNAIFLNRNKVDLPYKKPQTKEWIKAQVVLPADKLQQNRDNQLQICSGILKANDKDDLQIRKIKLIAE